MTWDWTPVSQTIGKQILEAAPNKASAVCPLTTHHENNPS